MRKTLLALTGVVLLAGGGVAMAQMPPGGPQAGPPGGPPPGGPEHREPWGMHHWHHHEDNAAFFRFRRGDAEMDIKCPANEQVQACVTAAGNLMDKVAAMQGQKSQ